MVNRKNNITDNDRKQIIQKSLAGFSAKKIFNILNLKYKAVWLIISKFKKPEIIKKKIRVGDKSQSCTKNLKLNHIPSK